LADPVTRRSPTAAGHDAGRQVLTRACYLSLTDRVA
jgi:hypothetical protein